MSALLRVSCAARGKIRLMMTAIPKTMRAFVLTGHGEMDKLEWTEDFPAPTPGPDEALVRVLACGLNNTDINTRTGWYSAQVSGATGAESADEADDGAWGGKPLSFPRIQGADVCGEVAAVSDPAFAHLQGRRVLADGWRRDWSDPRNRAKCGYFGSEYDGGFAEYCAVPLRQLHPVERKLSAAEFATFPTSGITALNMARRAEIGPGDRVLITGASGGVGGFLTQIAKALGAVAIGMCGAGKEDAVRGWGADFILPRAPENLREALRRETGNGEVSVVADVVGGEIWGEFIGALGAGGRYVCSGAIAGPAAFLDLRRFYLRDLSLLGATTTPPELFGDLVGMIERGEIQPMLAGTWPLRELKTAQEAFLSKRHAGKLAVIVAED